MTARITAFPMHRVEHDNCPRCGALNGPFERLGSGICNACLSKRQKSKQKSKQPARKTAHPARKH